MSVTIAPLGAIGNAVNFARFLNNRSAKRRLSCFA